LAEDRWNLATLQEQYQVSAEDVEQLQVLAKFYYESGSYVEAAELLHFYRLLATDTQKKTDATWGKLASEILVSNWEEASKDILALTEHIEEPVFELAKQQQQKAWLANWSLFLHFQFWNGHGLNSLLDTLCTDRYLPAIQAYSPWVLRYLAIASIITKSHLKELVKVVEQEIPHYTDPIIEFIRCLYIQYDFNAAEQKLEQCGPVLVHDYIVNGTAETKGLIEQFLTLGRTAICEAYCKIHSTIDINMMAAKLGKSYEESERWIVNLIRNSKLDAKIDSEHNQVIVQATPPDVYHTLMDKTKTLLLRTHGMPSPLPKA
jgi:translation initiation factor 3 subunit E